MAQAANFFILLFLLWRFAYRPILGILKRRREEIEKGLEFTKKAEEELRDVEIARENTIKKAHKAALAIVGEAEETGQKKKEEILAEARKKVEDVIADAKRAIAEEKAKMGEAVFANARELVRLGVAQVLGKLPSEEKNRALVDEALKKLREFGVNKK